MLQAVWRYTIQATPTEHSMPSGAVVQGWGWQEAYAPERKQFSLWMLVDPRPEVVEEKRTFIVLGTGHTYDPGGDEALNPNQLVPIGSMVAPNGFHAFHILEIK